MMEKANCLLNNERYLITPSLLNSWQYMWLCDDYYKDSAYKDFLNALNRVKIEPNKYMIAGIEYEQECYEGKTDCSPIIKNGAYQIVGQKKVEIDGVKFLMYGRLDVLKAGIIYDIKRVNKYELQKYINSHQHAFYLELFPNAYKFQYLAFDGTTLHKEDYMREDCEDIKEVIKTFYKWLKDNKLLSIYKQNWKCKGDLDYGTICL